MIRSARKKTMNLKATLSNILIVSLILLFLNILINSLNLKLTDLISSCIAHKCILSCSSSLFWVTDKKKSSLNLVENNSSIVLGFFNPMSQLRRTDFTTFCMQFENSEDR